MRSQPDTQGNPESMAITIARGLERSEADAWSDLYRNPPEEAANDCGLELHETGSATAVIASEVDVLAFNRVIGLGVEQPVTASEIDFIIDRFRQAGVRCSVQRPRLLRRLQPLPSEEDDPRG